MQIKVLLLVQVCCMRTLRFLAHSHMACFHCAHICVLLCRAVVGEVDEELDSAIDLGQVQAPPLKAIVH